MALPRREVDNLPRALRGVIRNPHARWRRTKLTQGQRQRLRRFLDKHGHITPNFTWAEARSKSNPRERSGKAVPDSLKPNAIRHAWNLERVRYEAGAALTFLSWYRTPIHNAHVGGASQSRHMNADATDFTPQTIQRVGRQKFMAILNKVFKEGGVGDYPSGAVHADSRGYRARWTSF